MHLGGRAGCSQVTLAGRVGWDRAVSPAAQLQEGDCATCCRGSLLEPTDPGGANTLRCPQPRCRAPPWPSLPPAWLFLKLRSHRKTLAASALPTDAWICKRRGRKVGAGAGTSGIREHGSVHHCPWPLGGSWLLSERLHWAWEPPTWGPSPSPASRAGSPGGVADGGPLAPALRCRSTK